MTNDQGSLFNVAPYEWASGHKQVHAETCDLDDDCTCKATMLERLQVLRLEPGDNIILSCPQDISESVAARLKTQVEDRFPGHRVVIFSGGARLGIVRRPAEEPDWRDIAAELAAALFVDDEAHRIKSLKMYSRAVILEHRDGRG